MEGWLTPGNIIVALVVVVALIVGGRRAIEGLTKGRSCCTDGSDGARPAPRAVKVADRDPARYAYETELLIGGMSCEHCAQTVERALNALPGTWAKVDLAAHTARVRTKEPLDRDACEAVVKAAGYYVMKL